MDILIETEQRQWNHEFIDGIFCPQEDELIKAIPLAQAETDDTLSGLGRLMDSTHANLDIGS